MYEGFARAHLGEIEGANLIKLHRHSGKVSYLVYPDFDADPHPALLRSINLNLRTREISRAGSARWRSLRGAGRSLALAAGCGETQDRSVPHLAPAPAPRTPIRLTGQEERTGLLDETATIGNRAGWAERLREWGYALRGHPLVRDRPLSSSSDDPAR